MHIPLFEGLSSKNLLEFGMQYPKVRQALPLEEREIDKLLRKYVGNLIYTLVGEPFRVWVESVIQERNKKLCEDRNLNIEMDPEVYKVFMESTSVSSKLTFPTIILLFYSRQGHQRLPHEEERRAEEEQGPDHGGQDAGGVPTEGHRGEAAAVEPDEAGAGRGAGENPGDGGGA